MQVNGGGDELITRRGGEMHASTARCTEIGPKNSSAAHRNQTEEQNRSFKGILKIKVKKKKTPFLCLIDLNNMKSALRLLMAFCRALGAAAAMD